MLGLCVSFIGDLHEFLCILYVALWLLPSLSQPSIWTIKKQLLIYLASTAAFIAAKIRAQFVRLKLRLRLQCLKMLFSMLESGEERENGALIRYSW